MFIKLKNCKMDFWIAKKSICWVSKRNLPFYYHRLRGMDGMKWINQGRVSEGSRSSSTVKGKSREGLRWAVCQFGESAQFMNLM